MDELEGWELISRNFDTGTEVYKVFDPQLQQMMCVKRQYFQSFTEATEGLSEPNNQLRLKDAHVCQIHAFQTRKIEERWALEIEMELLDCNGREAIQRRRGVSWSEEELLDMLKALVRVLAMGQICKISHRDIKPTNILFDKNSVMKLADFSSSKWGEEQTTAPQIIQGTVGFISPLLFSCFLNYILVGSYTLLHHVYKSDVYSLGVSFICFAKLLTTPPSRPFNLQLPEYPRLASLLTRMTENEESQRPDFIELEELLRKVLE
jgi:serine/threonine protein kinase